MSYTEGDVIENIYKAISYEGACDIERIKSILICWYEKEKSYREVNEMDTTRIDEKLDFLKGKKE